MPPRQVPHILAQKLVPSQRLPASREPGVAFQERLGKSAEGVQPVFVTLDPDRDTRQRLASYVTFFHPRLIGLTGDARAIAQAARAYKVYYAKVATSGGSYTVDHSGYIYLMDRAGRYLGFFPPGTPPERMADVIRPFLEVD